VLGAIGLWIVGDDLAGPHHHITRYDTGPEGLVAAFIFVGLVAGFYLTQYLVTGGEHTRSGYTLSYPRIAPRATGYREMTALTIGDLTSALRELGYQLELRACDEDGSRRRAAVDERAPLAGANVAILDRKVSGWIRVHLPVPIDEGARAAGLVDVWRHRGPSVDELALYTVRALDRLIGDVRASLEDSQLEGEPATLLTSALSDRPTFRAA